MQVSGDMGLYSTNSSMQYVKDQTQVSLLKKAMQLNETVIKELLQKGLQTQPQPPKNDQGTISLYA